jgi:hypothetical protein
MSATVTAVPVFDLGDTRYIGNHSSITGTSAFKNSAGADTDPSTVTIRVKKPDGTTTVYVYGGSPAALREAAGRFYVAVAFDQAGPWGWALVGTGAVAEATGGRFYVRESPA